MGNGVGKTGINQYRATISIWKICVPLDIDRDKYIKNCYLTGTVSLINENAEIVSNVKIGKLALQLVDFPDDNESTGSEIVCATAPYSGRLYVIDVYGTGRQAFNQEENQYRFFKTNEAGSAGILIDGNGNIILTVDGDSDNGAVTLNVTNQDRAGKLNVIVNGDILVENDGNTTIKTKRFEVGIEDKEPILLGQKTIDLLDELLTQLGQESAGPYPLLGASKYLDIKEKLEALKSAVSFTQ